MQFTTSKVSLVVNSVWLVDSFLKNNNILYMYGFVLVIAMVVFCIGVLYCSIYLLFIEMFDMVIYRPKVSSLLTVHKGTWLQEDILLMYVSNILSHSKSNWYSSPTKRLMSVQAMRFSINSIYFHYLNCTEGNRSVIITPWAVNSQTNLCIKMFLSRGKKVLIQWPT